MLAYDYKSAQDWKAIEYLVLYLASSWSVRAMRGWPGVIPLTTFALDTREESRIVALPLERAKALNARTMIVIP